MSSKRAASSIDPYFLGAIFVGVGLGTVLLEQRVRLALLAVTLAALCLVYRAKSSVALDFSPAALGRGAFLGLVIALPLLAFLSEQLRLFTERLYATRDVVQLFYQICFVSAPLEECFFRGVLQKEKGLSVGITASAVAALVYFVPHVPIVVTLITFVALGSLGIVYAYIFERHGLTASIACHVVVGFILQVMPLIIEWARMTLS